MKNNLLSWASAAMLLFNVITLQAQTTYTVDNTPNSGAQFTDVQSAINAASDGDTIYVQQSATPYSGPNGAPINVDKQLTIVGRSHLDNGYTTTTSQIVLTNGSSGAVLKGLYIAGGLDTQFDPMISNAVISNILVQDCRLGNIRIGSNNSQIAHTVNSVIIRGSTTGGITLGQYARNVTIENNVVDGLSVDNASTLLFTNNIVYFNSSNTTITSSNNVVINITDNIFLSQNNSNQLNVAGNYQFNNCLFFNPNTPSQVITIATNSFPVNNQRNSIFGQDPLFTNLIGGTNRFLSDYKVLSGSPAISSGVNGGNIGFRSNFIFKILGNPKGVPEVKITNYQSIAPQNGTVTFNIEARSH